jgi:hypothetical protein
MFCYKMMRNNVGSKEKGIGRIKCFIAVHIAFIIYLAQQPPVGQDLPIHEVSRSHTATHHSPLDCSGRVISSSQRPLPDNTQHPKQTDIHAPGGIRNHNFSRRAAANLRLRPRGLWDRHSLYL